MKFKRILAGLTLGVLAAPLALVGCGKKNDKDVYNFVLTNATIPPVMAALDCIDDEDAKTYMWYGRKQTFADTTKLGFEMMEGNNADNVLSSGISATALENMQNEVMRLYANDKNVHFNLYVTDYGVEAAFKMFIENGIPAENYTVKFVEDGTGSYTKFKELYGAEKNETVGEEAGSAKFEKDKQTLLNEVLPAVKNGSYNYSVGSYHYELSYVFAATQSNVEYYLQYPEYLDYEDEAMEAELDNITFKKANLTEMYKALDEEHQTAFKEAVLGKEYAEYVEELLTPDENGKKTLVVCGTSFTGEQFSEMTDDVKNGTPGASDFEKFFNKIKEDYGDEYSRIVIKPHPNWGLANEDFGITAGANWTNNNKEYEKAYERRVQYCQENNITVLSGQVPMEVLIWAYGGENNDQIGIGGYYSSLFMNAPKNMTKFFIFKTQDMVDTLEEPIRTLVQNGEMADELKVYYPGSNGEVEVLTKTYTAA